MREQVLAGIAAGRPEVGPQDVHVDITNGCNAACVTCWDHSPLLDQGRSADWKRRRLSLSRFEALVDELAELGSVGSMVVSGMGDPLTHPQVYEMLAAVKARGWRLTVLTNLVAADIDRLEVSGVDNLLVSVQGVSPESYAAFHPGWDEREFTTLCRYLRRLARAGVQVRHVQVINRDTADELVDMVRFGRTFGAARVNYKLASLFDGTEACTVTDDQLHRLADDDIPRARALAAELGVHTNLDLFEQQVAAARQARHATVPIAETGCFMGYVYTRITVDLEVLYCCNTKVRVGSLRDTRFAELWWGERWQALRDTVRAGRFFAGCEVCGKYEQNRKWSERVRA